MTVPNVIARGLLAAVLVIESTTDEPAPDLACARANLVELRVTEKASGGIVIDVTVATWRTPREDSSRKRDGHHSHFFEKE